MLRLPALCKWQTSESGGSSETSGDASNSLLCVPGRVLHLMPGQGGSQNFLCRQQTCGPSPTVAWVWGQERIIPNESDMTQASLPHPMLIYPGQLLG